MQWDSYFARRTELTTRSTIRELLKYTIQPEVISFAGGLPAPELFPSRAHSTSHQHSPYSTRPRSPAI